ncbi:MAG: nucleotidyltransferase family protein [Sedimentisphaerales bacterium]|jgi:predicted nucleotidyltransferase
MGIEFIKEKVVPILRRHNVKRASLFGSVVRGEAREDSDVDILVELPKGLSLFDFVGIQLELEEALGVKVDLGEYSTIKSIIREQIMSEQVPIYEEKH